MNIETELFSFTPLYNAYRQARKGKRKKPAEAFYERNALDFTYRLIYQLKHGKYKPSKFETFYVYEPKKRLVEAPAFKDRVVLHSIVDNYMYEEITKNFIFDSYASQKNKGMHMGLYRVKSMFTDYWCNNRTSEGWILKADVKKFFHSINHDKLKEVFRKTIDSEDVYNFMEMFIDKTEKGLPLGYQTSQLLALLYLNGMDHYIKDELGVKYYGRYMDDFFLIGKTKDEVKGYLNKILEYTDSLELTLNHKTNIFPIKNGIDMIGFHIYMTETGKVITKIRRSSVRRMKKKIKYWKSHEVPKDEIYRKWQSWDSHASFGDTKTLRDKIASEVSEILGYKVEARKKRRFSKKMEARVPKEELYGNSTNRE